MKNLLYFTFIILFFTTCKKENNKETATLNGLNITGFKVTNSSNELVNLNLTSGKMSTSNVNCFILGSTIYDTKNQALGYVDCNSIYVLRSIATNQIIKTIPLPGLVSLLVSDPIENTIIGLYYPNDSSYIVKIDVATGKILANNYSNLKNPVGSCSYVYRQKEKDYLLMGIDSNIMYLNPNTGKINKILKIDHLIVGYIFDEENNRMIGLNYNSKTFKNNMITIDLETGNTLSIAELKESYGHIGCMYGYDKETNSFIMINYPQNKLLFIDINSGELNKTYQLDFGITGVNFWRK